MKHATMFVLVGVGLVTVALFALNMRVVAKPTAPTFTLNSPFDVPADPSDTDYTVCRTATFNTTCTLRAAIMKANRYAGGGVTINIPSGAYTITLAPSGEDDETNGDLNITQTVTIVGAGAVNSIIDGGSVDRVFRIQTGVAVTLTDITIRNGVVAYGFPVSAPIYDGGGVYNQGSLTLLRDVIAGNEAYFSGDGIYNAGTMILSTSVITGNYGYGGGNEGGGIFNTGTATLNNTSVTRNYATYTGGIANLNGAVMTLSNSTVSANTTGSGYNGGSFFNYGTLTMNTSAISANSGGIGGGLFNGGTATLNNVTVNNNNNNGLYNDALYGGGGIYNESGGVLTMNNSTISANSTTLGGGGIANKGTTRLFFVTIAGNLADSNAVGGGNIGGGISNTVGTVELWNTFLAENYHGSVSDDCGGIPLTSQDYNYIQTTAGCTLGGTTTHNVYGGDALLGPLQNNGGATQTRALWVGSPAIDQIPPAQCRDSYGTAPQPDQRGVVRPVNGLCDIGAFEGAQPTPIFNRNLIRNGDAENSAGSSAGAYVGTANWTKQLGQFTVVPYNAPLGFPNVLTDTVPAKHGYNFFSGGFDYFSIVTQTVPVSTIQAAIDAGVVNYAAAGDFGGIAAQEDYGEMTIYFLDGTGTEISHVTIGDVTAAQRGNLTGLLHRSASGLIPVGTRTINIEAALIMITPIYNQGFADNLSLVLTSNSLFLPIIQR